MRRHTRLVLVATALAVATAPLSALGSALADAATEGQVVQPPGSIGIRLLDIPVDRVDDPRARTSIVDHIIPGATLDRRIEVVSTVDAPLEAELYATSATIRDGAFVPGEEGEGIADWITISPSQLSLAPSATETVTIEIDVPGGAPTGEQYAIVWVEPPPSEGQVGVANRVGLRIYLSVGTGDEPPVDFAIGSMTAARTSEGVPVVTTTMRNTGGRALDITGVLHLSDGPAGLDAGPFAFDGSVSLAPGEVGDITISLDPELPDGPWTARLDAVSGLLERSAEGEILFPASAGSEAPPADTETIGGTDAEGNDISERLRGQRRALLPLAALLILGAVVALYLMLLWKRREEDEDEEDADGAPAEAAVGADAGDPD